MEVSSAGSRRQRAGTGVRGAPPRHSNLLSIASRFIASIRGVDTVRPHIFCPHCKVHAYSCLSSMVGMNIFMPPQVDLAPGI